MNASALKLSVTENFASTFWNETYIGKNWVPSTEPEDLIPLSLLKSVFPNQTDIEQVLRKIEQLDPQLLWQDYLYGYLETSMRPPRSRSSSIMSYVE